MTKINKSAAKGKHYMKYTISEADVGEEVTMGFVIDRLKLKGFAKKILTRIDMHADTSRPNRPRLVIPPEVGTPLDPFYMHENMNTNIFNYTIYKKAIRLGSGKAGKRQDLKEIISTCKRAKVGFDGAHAWNKFYSSIEALCEKELSK